MLQQRPAGRGYSRVILPGCTIFYTSKAKPFCPVLTYLQQMPGRITLLQQRPAGRGNSRVILPDAPYSTLLKRNPSVLSLTYLQQIPGRITLLQQRPAARGNSRVILPDAPYSALLKRNPSPSLSVLTGCAYSQPDNKQPSPRSYHAGQTDRYLFSSSAPVSGMTDISSLVFLFLFTDPFYTV
ncbi:hypothetical protein C7431_103556 [Pantoea allii]|uniref:Uncharacterized protein n=1 Tax=Pantoea allii TaxID=574096 RepID=A0A2V2BQ12_9GAMM|nr:hypothetical protein C7431_103556 [Pantoea allii]